jgi:hypothetical protein
MSWVSEALNRGVTVRRSQHVVGKDKNTGRDITTPGPYVYMFKDKPGEYYDERGNKVTEGLAKMVGFPTSKLAAMRAKQEKMATVEAELRAQLDAELAAMGDEKDIIAERGEWVLIGLGGGRAAIEDKTGNRITAALPKEEAQRIMDLTYPEDEGKIESKSNKGKE